MEFLNEQVPVEQLPRQEQVQLTPIESSYLTVLRWEWLIGSTLLGTLAGVLFYFIKKLHEPLWMSLIGGFWLLLTIAWFWLQTKGFTSRAYAIREKDIIYRSGWIIQTTHTCPFNRIQHSAVSIGPLEKTYGFASLVLYTAGSDEADLKISGLSESIAWNLKEWITQKISDEPSPTT